MLNYKSFEQIVDDVIDRLKTTTPITDFSPGSVARAFVDTFAGEVATLYRVIEVNLATARLSTAKGRFLDLLGAMVGVTRREGEGDDNYRYRIAHRWEEAATSNEIAVRLAALSVPGVRDVMMRPYVLGSGSFSVYPVAETGVDPTSLVKPIEDAMQRHAGYGIRHVVTLGEELPVGIEVEILFDPILSSGEQERLLREAEHLIGTYIESLGLGSPLVITQILHRIMSLNQGVSKAIKDVRVTGLEINYAPTLVENAYPEWDERYVPASIRVRAA